MSENDSTTDPFHHDSNSQQTEEQEQSEAQVQNETQGEHVQGEVDGEEEYLVGSLPEDVALELEAASELVNSLNSHLSNLGVEQEEYPSSPMESSVDTFLEFTGTQDRERAIGYLTAAEGNLEQAVNLFLSGAPLHLFQAPLHRARGTRQPRNAPSTASVLVGGLLGQLDSRQQRQHFLQQNSENEQNSQSPTSGSSSGSNRGWLYQRHAAMEVESALLALGGAELEEMMSSMSSGVPTWTRDAGKNGKRILDDSQRSSSQIEALRAGIWEKVPEIGTGCLRSVKSAQVYLELGLAKVVAECLPFAVCQGEDATAVRLLQLMECSMRIVCDGHSDAVDHCGWWFIPARRSGSRRYARNSYTEMFIDQVVPNDNIEALQQMWINETFDPSWRDKRTEAEMLACALNQGCSPELLQVLVDPVNGCRANVNPDPDRLGSLPTPLLIAASGAGFDKAWKRKHAGETTGTKRKGSLQEEEEEEDGDDVAEEEVASDTDSLDQLASSLHHQASLSANDPPPKAEREEWSRKCVEILLDFGACVDDDILSCLDSMTTAARKLILAEKEGTRVSERQLERAKQRHFISDTLVEEWWNRDARRYFRALLRTIALSKHNATVHRAMEILAMLVERFRPLPKQDAVNTLGKQEYEKLMQLLQSVFTPENDDVTALLLSVKTIRLLLETTQAEDLSEQALHSSTVEQKQQPKTECEEDEENDEEAAETLGIHAQFCLSLCRFGITFRLRELSSTAAKQFGSEELQTAAKLVVEKVSACVVDQLGLTEETLLGRSTALMDVCQRLRNGDTSVLEHLVWMMGRGQSQALPGSQFFDNDEYDDLDGDEDSNGYGSLREDDQTDDEDSLTAGPPRVKSEAGQQESHTMYGNEGITAFEFEQSGLPSALLHFLLAKDVQDLSGSIEAVQAQRMHALLSAMPPPVVGGDQGDLDDEEEVKAGDGDNGQKATSPRESEGQIGAGRLDEFDDDDKNNDRDQLSPSPTTGDSQEELGGLQYRFGASGRRSLTRRPSSTLGRQPSLTLESVQNLATSSLESMRSSGGNENIDSSAFTASALYRLISKLQMVLAVHAVHNFPVIAHDSMASSGGVRALVNPRKIHLRRDEELDQTTSPYPEAQDLVVQVLPLTPLYEFQKQVLRAVRITDPRYEAFCRKLVGRKVIHRASNFDVWTKDSSDGGMNQCGLVSPGRGGRSPVGTPARRSPSRLGSPARSVTGESNRGVEYTVALVLRYDPYTGAHLLQDLGSSNSSKAAGGNAGPSGTTSSRILNKKGNKQWFLMNMRDYQVLERVFDGPSSEELLAPMIKFQEDTKRVGKDKASHPHSMHQNMSIFPAGSEVAVWWRGDDNLCPGWRAANIVAVHLGGAGQCTYDVQYEGDELVHDDIIRVGDKVRLIEDVEALQRLAKDHGGWTDDMANYCGKTARVTAIRGSQVNTDGLGDYVYNIKALIKLAPGSSKAEGEREAGDGEKSHSLELGVPQRRVFSLDAIPQLEDRHIFSVFLLPENYPQKQSNNKTNQSEDTNTEVKQFKLNDRIEARYAGKSRYYKGRIARVNADGTYDLAYDDGDSERGVKPHLVCHIGQGPGKVVSYDFRKVFPNSAGRALFEALRREDAVLHQEYNFVTRGFEHQPDFYAKFSQTLEQEGSGVFAQFQTRHQAEILFTRVQKCGQTSPKLPGTFGNRGGYLASAGGRYTMTSSSTTSGASSAKDAPSSPVSPTQEKRVVRAFVDIFPDTEIPAVVERDIITAFEHTRDRFGRGAKKSSSPPPPPPGFRAQVNVKPLDFHDPITRSEDPQELRTQQESEGADERWVSATVVGRRPCPEILSIQQDETSATSNNAEEEKNDGDSKAKKPCFLLTCVLDDGRIIWDIPEKRVRVAQRTSRVFPFRTKERSLDTDATAAGLSPAPEGGTSAARDPASHAEPVELSRQFTAFGQSTSYKRIRFSSFNEEDEEELGIQTLDDDTENESDSDDGELTPPRFEVDFLVCRMDENEEENDQGSGGGDGDSEDGGSHAEKLKKVTDPETSIPILANQDGEISMFQALFLLENMDMSEQGKKGMARPSSGDHPDAKTNPKWQKEFWLKWRVRCVFPGDPGFESGTNRLRDKLPWRTPRALAFEVANSRSLTLEAFCEKLIPIVPDFLDWAKKNKLDDILNYMSKRATGGRSQVVRSRSQIAVNWAAICVAYAQLCQRPYSKPEGEFSPAVSPIRSPTLLKKDMLGIKMIGSEGFPLSPSEEGEGVSLKEIVSPPPAPGSDLLRLLSEPDSLEHVRSLLDECGVDDSVSGLRDTLLLLHLLYSELVPFDESADPLAAAFGKSLPWRNETLSDLLREQLSDPLAIATRCFPKWVAVFPREFSFLFRTKIRQTHLRCTALGVSRAVAWLQDEVTGYKAKKRQLAHVTLEISAMFRGVPDMARYEHLQELSDRLEDELKAIEQEHCIGQLHQDLVKVNRSELLHDAEQLMRQHMSQRSELVVQFLDETGAGDGVTMDFYSSVSERLQLVEENLKIPMFVNPSASQNAQALSGRDKERERGGSEGSNTSQQQEVSEESGATIPPSASPKAEGAQEEKYGEEDPHIVSPGGLFPQPLFPLGSVKHSMSGYVSRPMLSVNTKSSPGASGGGGKLSTDDRVERSMRLEVSEGKEDGLRVETKEILGDPLEDGLRAAEERNNKVVQRFRFLGRLMAKALLDGMNVPIPLSPEFFMLIQQRQRGCHDTLLPVSTLSLIEGADLSGGDEMGLDSGKGKSSGYGIVRRLYELQKAKDLDGIEALLGEIELRFVDPSQPPLPVSKNQRQNDGSGISRSLAEEFDMLAVPAKGASANALLEYAERASRLGKTQTQIDESLAEAGHPKLLRWKAIKGSQKTRTRIALERAEEMEKSKESSATTIASELVPGGASRRVTVSNVGEYLELILLWWLGHGIERQADAFCDGLCDVLGLQGRDALLFNFSHSELRRMLCGREEIQWKEEDPLLGCIVPMGDYRDDSPPILMLVEVLKKMSMNERAQFLNFVTSQPRVPLSGLPQIKVYPPMMECIPGIIVRLQNESDCSFRIGDRVTLSQDYAEYDDACDGPLGPGDTGLVTSVERRVRVSGWWYDPKALQLARKDLSKSTNDSSESFPAKESWFKAGEFVRTAKARVQVGSWDAEKGILYFHKSADMSALRTFKSGQSLEVISDDSSASKRHPPLRVEKVLEQPQPIQMRPYLRPKATTCAKTLYLPSDYDSAEHMLEVFRGAFADAKLGGIHEA